MNKEDLTCIGVMAVILGVVAAMILFPINSDPALIGIGSAIIAVVVGLVVWYYLDNSEPKKKGLIRGLQIFMNGITIKMVVLVNALVIVVMVLIPISEISLTGEIPSFVWYIEELLCMALFVFDYSTLHGGAQ